MVPESVAGLQTASSQFVRVCLRALVRAEVAGRVPARFTGTGREVWETFRNELTATDLAALVIQDAGVAMPVPFDPGRWWPEWPAGALFHQEPAVTEGWIVEALTQAREPRDAYLRRQVATLEIDLPSDALVARIPTPPRHERWLELPGTGGWLAYCLCNRPEAELYYWENLAVACGTPQEMLLAGLIAWEMGAPPHTDLPIWLDGADLARTLASGKTYHGIVGLGAQHGHRDLRVLLMNDRQPIWLPGGEPG